MLNRIRANTFIFKQILPFITVAVFFVPAFSADISINGSIKDSLNNPIKDVSVTLLGKAVNTSSDSCGNFRLESLLSIAHYGKYTNQSSNCYINGNILSFTLSANSNVSLDLFSTNGQLINHLLERKFSQGKTSVNLSKFLLPQDVHQVYILSLNINGKKTFFKIANINQLSNKGISTVINNSRFLTLKKSYAVYIDTLKFEKYGYLTQYLPIKSYEISDLSVILKHDSLTNPKIKLKGDSVIVINQGEKFSDPGATATDSHGNTLAIKTISNVDTSRAGKYGITYTTVDSFGIRVSIGRIVKVKGKNLLADKNPHLFKDKMSYYSYSGLSYSDDSHINDGSGCAKLEGQGADVYSVAITTPMFYLEKGKHYTLSAYVKMTGIKRGQNIFFQIVPQDNSGETIEILWNVAEEGEWEEMIMPYRPKDSGNYEFSLFIHKYGYSTDGELIKPDLSNMAESPTIYYDDFSVVESEDIVSREPYTSKKAFESSNVRIDTLGNWSIKEDGVWKNIFPKLAYQTWLPDFKLNAQRYAEYGFTGYANITDINKLKTAIDVGMKYNCIQVNSLNDETKNFINSLNDSIKNNVLPTTAVIMYKNDNEGKELAYYNQKKAVASWLDENDKDPLTQKRSRPIFVLNGVAEGLARNLKSSHCDVMDVTGSYVGQHGEATDVRTNPVNTMEMLDKIHMQKAPVSIIQMQSYYLYTFVPMLFKGIINGGKGLSFWRGGTEHNGSKMDFRENYWAPAIKGSNGVFAKIDKMLPIIREPYITNWSATIPQELTETVAIGTRTHKGKHYIILANFADKQQTVLISIGGIYATKAKDYFTKEVAGLITDGKLAIDLSYFNSGYKVLELE